MSWWVVRKSAGQFQLVGSQKVSWSGVRWYSKNHLVIGQLVGSQKVSWSVSVRMWVGPFVGNQKSGLGQSVSRSVSW